MKIKRWGNPMIPHEIFKSKFFIREVLALNYRTGPIKSPMKSERCFVRTVPPSFSASYAEGHDRGMQATMATLLEGIPGDASQ